MATSHAHTDKHPQRDFERRLAVDLIAAGIASDAEIQEAIEHQVLMGGDLLTNLWELGIADIKTLTPHAARLLALKPVPPRVVARTPTRILHVITPKFAATQRMIPLGVRNRVLSVALSAPWNLQALDDLAFRTGCKPQPYYLAEVPLVQLLDKLYGIRASARFRMPPQQRLKTQESAAPTADTVGEDLMDDAAFEALYGGGEPAASTPPAPPTDTAELLREGDAVIEALILEDGDDEPAELLELAAVINDEELGEVTMDADDAPSANAATDHSGTDPRHDAWAPLADRAQAQALLAAADSREALGRVLVRVALAKGPRAVLLTFSGGVWLGWTGYGPGIDPDAVRGLMIPSQAGTCFGTVGTYGGQFIGPLAPHAIHDRFLGILGGAKPRTAGLFPVHYHGRVVFGIYTDGGDGADLDHDIANILIVAQQVPRALDRLIQERRAP